MTGALSEHGSETPMAQDAKYPLGVAMVLVAGVCLFPSGSELPVCCPDDQWDAVNQVCCETKVQGGICH